MKKEEKQQYLSDFVEELKGTSGIIITDYQGLNVQEMTELRRGLAASGGRYRVVKNKITALAFDKVELKDLNPHLEGPTAIATLKGDPIPAVKGIVKFVKDHEKLRIKSGYLYDRIVSPSEIESISELPTKEVAAAQLLSVMQMPMQKFVCLLNNTVTKFVCLIDAIKDKKGGETSNEQ